MLENIHSELDKLFIKCFPGIEELSKRANKSPSNWACERLDMIIRLEQEMLKTYQEVFIKTESIDFKKLRLCECDSFSVRTFGALDRAGYTTMADLVEASVDDIRNIDRVGPVALREIQDALRSVGVIKDLLS